MGHPTRKPTKKTAVIKKGQNSKLTQKGGTKKK